MPLLIEAPMNTPTAATAITRLKEAAFEPTVILLRSGWSSVSIPFVAVPLEWLVAASKRA